ncbi:integrase family protein [Sphaerotilus natans subsp. natans DSM 6575]|uniref:Integrase family protein n=1 Tax=Sphaerotilus natans subsp. natans DSM 6575 TaxID=1286631 RepID=A0A059KGK4_9BURK|nr:integrase arm-type DNA-binding domain-containing protein [Sphaerotilus natans]KDB50490.1 integrase family protein [Sphaerotilus natans subsp. natans DSM 6575]SIS07839.1 Integrase [Sphaerotilus natans]
MPENILSDQAIKKAKPEAKPRKLSDGGGLLLEVRPEGGKWWRLRYRFAGKEKMLSLGVYPAVALADARKRRDEARALLAAGIDPSAARKDSKAEQARQQHIESLVAQGKPLPGTFEHVARDWLEKKHEPEVSPRYSARSRKQLETDVFPHIGRMPMREITAPVLLELLRKVEARGATDTAHRVKQTCGLVFRYAITTGDADRDPVPDLRGALATHTKRHFPAITDPVRVGELLRAFDAYTGQPGTRTALKLAAMVFQRPGNLIAMRWEDLDLDAATWSIPSEDMKRTKGQKLNGAAHVVPLARQAVALLRELHPLTGHGVHCFPGLGNKRHQPISNVTLNAAMRRLGFSGDEMTAHGFRALARTVIVENLPGVDSQWIEAQLAHAKKGPLGSAYDRAQYLHQRRQMMQTWADYLDRLRDGAQVIPIRAA